MDVKTLLPVDDSPTARKTVEAVIANRKRLSPKLTLLHVVNEQLAYRMIPDFQLEMVRETARKFGQKHLAQIAGQLEGAGFEVDKRLEFGAPRQLITKLANDEGFQLLIIGRHAGGGEIRDVLFGSVANYVLHNVRCPVLLF